MNRVQTDPLWRSFEKAIAEFVQALDPQAEVKHDIKLPDRQRSEWDAGCRFDGRILDKFCKRIKSESLRK